MILHDFPDLVYSCNALPNMLKCSTHFLSTISNTSTSRSTSTPSEFDVIYCSALHKLLIYLLRLLIGYMMTVEARAAVGVGIPMGIPMGMGMVWVWGL